ncbi:hypothetical protein GC093_15275 [Paenibacillus sp. LMG 31456]|uniref:VCBS repeat-containing protein n=1 Tax=Paenibacillus foliorum TaxID=2654974 RepID=A0A972K176_9BACL|nr:hypothetical protein [Paenibacillus foliorum]NOU94570.1 hypothetical protein [Paenibacillus foliorum]
MLSKPLRAGMILTALWITTGCGMPAAPIDLIKPPATEGSFPKDNFRTTLQALLPDGARLLIPHHGNESQVASFGDVDGDGVDEAVVVYEESSLHEKMIKASLLKQQNAVWRIVGDANGLGYGVDYVQLADLNGDGTSEIMLGWSLGAGGTGMDIYEWRNNALKLRGKKGYDNPLQLDKIPGQAHK